MTKSKENNNQIKRKINKTKQHLIKRKQEQYGKTKEIAEKTEILLTEDCGLIEVSDGHHSRSISQSDIKNSVDVTSATKIFNLDLKQYGPYKFCYTSNGSHVVIAGRKGHVGHFNWLTKKLNCEINVMDSIYDVKFLDNEQRFAVAQKDWTYIYDNQGVELHCLKMFYKAAVLEYLPYHFLLCCGNENGFLSWLDISLGKEVIKTPTHKGSLRVMSQNPHNAVLCCGHSNGVVTMWTPNSKKAVCSLLAHNQPVRALTFDPYGRYMATAGLDHKIKIWDARNLCTPLNYYLHKDGTSHLAYSQKGLLAAAHLKSLQVYKNVTNSDSCDIYLRTYTENIVSDLHFCPYEDVLGVSHQNGFQSLLIPGSGEPNFDALEHNPFIGKKARRENEVKTLLRKLPLETIVMDPSIITKVNAPVKEDLSEKQNLSNLRTDNMELNPKYKMKGKSGSAKKFIRKQKMKEDAKRQFIKIIKEKKETKQKEEKHSNIKKKKKTGDILDRF